MATESSLLVPVMNDNIAANVDTESVDVKLRQSRARQLFVDDWRQELLLGGFVYTFHVGGITGGGDYAGILGGGNGTTIDEDQPELGFGVPVGYTLCEPDQPAARRYRLCRYCLQAGYGRYHRPDCESHSTGSLEVQQRHRHS